MADQTNAMVVSGSKGNITLQSETLPDVRTILDDDQRKEARQMALAVDLKNTRAIMDFGGKVTLSPIAKKIADNTKVGEVRGTEAEAILVELGVLKTKMDPMRILNPKLQSGLFAAKRFADAVLAYKQDFDKMEKPMEALVLRAERSKDEEGTAIDELDALRNDCVSLYNQMTVLEAGYKYLIQRMIKKYNEDKANLKPGDQAAEQALADLGDYIGMVDRSTFDTHFARARVIVVGTQIRMMRKGDEEMYRMFQSQLTTALPIFQIEMAAAIKLVQGKKRLDVLNKLKAAEIKQAEQLDKALNGYVVAVAEASEDNTAAVQQLLSSYKGIAEITDKLIDIHTKGAESRLQMTGQINAVMVGLQKKVVQFDPTKLLEAPEDVKDVPLTMEK